MLLSGVQTFEDGFGSLHRDSGDGTTLDFSAVTGSLVFTISGDSVTVSYADTSHSDSLTYSADGQDYAIVGSQDSDQFSAANDGQLASIDGGAGDDTIRFDSTTGAVSFGADTIVTRGDSSTYSLTGIENFTNAGLSIPGFVDLDGNFALQSNIQTVTLDDGTSVSANVLRIGGHDVNAFAGLNGGSNEAVERNFSGVDFAVALMVNRADRSQKFTAVSASAKNVGCVGLNGLTVAEEDVAVAINRSSGASDVVVDFAATPVTSSVRSGSQEAPIAGRLRPLPARCRDGPH